MSRRKNQSRNFRTMKVTAPEAAAFLNLPERSFYRLVETGVIPKAGEGEYILGEVVESYWRNQFDSEGLKAAQTRLVTAQAELKEAELAENRGELHRASAIAKVWTDQVLNAKTHLLAIPMKVGPMLVGQELQVIVKKLKDAIYEALKELADYDSEKITRTAAILRNQ
ncbi:MAG: helix-turn-helix domain-containing protein [Synergistaceae bacterium]|nr:helix-turn-helix domain-containing protein [Synergistaceae bacterium]